MKHNKQRAKIIPEKILNATIDSCAKKPNEQKLKWIREQLAIKSMLLEREAQLQDLRKYEKEINEIDPHAHVSIINDVDLEGPPRQMEYINAYKAGEGISIPDDPFIGCSCDNGCDWKQRSCCSKTSGDFHFAYNKQGKLRDVIVVSSMILFSKQILFLISRLVLPFTNATRGVRVAQTASIGLSRRGGNTNWPSSGRTMVAAGA